MRTLARVSGRRSPTRPPQTSTDDASRMGIALVMPTSEPKIRLPSTAASLHKALQKPKPVPLEMTARENTAVTQRHSFVPRWEIFKHTRFPGSHWPPVCRVQLCCDHIQRVPGRDTEAVVETEHENHHRLAGPKPQEEAADTRQHHGAPCRTRRTNVSHITSPLGWTSVTQIASYPACSDGLFCPWAGQRRCSQAAPPGFPGSWQNRPSRRCSHRQMSSDSPSCCGGRSCWSLGSLLAWSHRYLWTCQIVVTRCTSQITHLQIWVLSYVCNLQIWYLYIIDIGNWSHSSFICVMVSSTRKTGGNTFEILGKIVFFSFCSRALLASMQLSWKRNDLLIKCSGNRKRSLPLSFLLSWHTPPSLPVSLRLPSSPNIRQTRCCWANRLHFPGGIMSTWRALAVCSALSWVLKVNPFFYPGLPQGLTQLRTF